MQTTLHAFLLATLAPSLSIEDITEMVSPRPEQQPLPSALEHRLCQAEQQPMLRELARHIRSEWLHGRRVTTDYAQRWALRNEASISRAVALVR